MVAVVARTGRELQRYSNGRRLVVGCIPYRLKPNNDDIDESMEVLVISSQKGQGTMFPKPKHLVEKMVIVPPRYLLRSQFVGGWEIDETMEAAAHREALEEAGVIGDVEDSLGQWSFVSKRYGTYYEGYVFPLRVTEILDQWPEDDVRKRRWVTVAEARENCQHWWMKEALNKLVDHLSNTTSYSPRKNRERQDIPC